MKLLSYAIPCYNSADYMDRCIESLLASSDQDDIEIIIVDDGSTKDATAQKADEWQQRFPQIIRAIHQENGGHGEAVNTGLRHAQGMYYKVVDSDDWLDTQASHEMMETLRELSKSDEPLDMLLCNYVYEHLYKDKQFPINYEGTFPEGRIFSWDETSKFNTGQFILMHSVIYRTQILRDCALELPKHTFYVDNLFVYRPLPYVQRMYYLNVDLYRYFIGRDDQSVHESVMINRIDQQLRVTRCMIDCVDINEEVKSEKLRRYMIAYLRMMMVICSEFLLMSDKEDKLELRDEIWNYLKNKDAQLYKQIYYNYLSIGSNLPTALGREFSVWGYHLAQKLYHFN